MRNAPVGGHCASVDGAVAAPFDDDACVTAAAAAAAAAERILAGGGAGGISGVVEVVLGALCAI